MARLNERVGRLEGKGSGAYIPPPEGAVIFAGPRDPVAIMRAIGLAEVPSATIEVLERGAVPGEPPRLVAPLTESGRAGMPEEFRKVSPEICSASATGEAWAFHWNRGGLSWMVTAWPPTFTEFDCMGEGNA